MNFFFEKIRCGLKLTDYAKLIEERPVVLRKSTIKELEKSSDPIIINFLRIWKAKN